MTLQETLKYMESHLTEASLGGVQQQINRLQLGDVLKVEQAGGNDIKVNDVLVKSPQKIIDSLYNELYASTDKNNAINKVNNLFNTQKVTGKLDGENVSKIPQIQNSNLPVVRFNSGVPATIQQQVTDLVSKNDIEGLCKELQVLQQQNNTELMGKVFGMIEGSNKNLAIQLKQYIDQKDANLAKILQQFATKDELNQTNEKVDELNNNLNGLLNQLVNFSNEVDNRLKELEKTDNQNIQLLEAPITDDNFEKSIKIFNDRLADAEKRNEQLQQMLQEYVNTVQNENLPGTGNIDKGNKNIGGINTDSKNKAKKSGGFFSKLGSGLVKGANVLAGIAGSFIGNMAGGMGAAK